MRSIWSVPVMLIISRQMSHFVRLESEQVQTKDMENTSIKMICQIVINTWVQN
jgi:hypothetical protein